MLLLSRGQLAEFKFIFVSEGNVYDPTSSSTPRDILFSIVRGGIGDGPIVDGPFSYLNQSATPNPDANIVKQGSSTFIFNYKVPTSLFQGVYSIVAQTTDAFGGTAITSSFQVKGDPITLSPVIISSEKSTITNYKPTYDELNAGNTSTILLIGHADGIEINNPIKIRSVQSAIDLLGADIKSPLLRGVLDAYSAGARDIVICAAAPMSEYVDGFSDRTVSTTLFDLNSATPNSYTFYEKYSDRLQDTYSLIKDLDFIDIVVPLEISMIKTGDIDFITQLGDYLQEFHNHSGYVQIGIIGSRTGGVLNSDVSLLESNSVITNKLTTYSYGNMSSDRGRFIIPIYGEAVFQHKEITSSYTSSIAAAYAGLLASTPLNRSVIRTRIPGAASVYGVDLTQSEYNRLEAIQINTIYRGKKTRRSVPYEVYISNEYTMAHPNSTLSKAAQMRLVARVVSQVRELSYQAVGRLGYDAYSDMVRNLLQAYKQDGVIVDYSFNIEVSPNSKSSIIVYIELLSALGLKKIDFAVATGPGA